LHDDTKLMQEFLAGSRDGFEKLIKKYRIPGIAFAKRYVSDFHEAEDIVQDSFADLFVYKDRYNSKYSFKTYLFSIIRNKAINVYKKRRNIDPEQYEGYAKSNPENDYLLSEMKDMVNTKLKVLHTDYQQALYLYEYENMSYKDIAVIMNKNLSKVKILIYRARKRLRTALEGYYYEQ
jgi:RNA polymerase sigma factor (sigma-70 family)